MINTPSVSTTAPGQHDLVVDEVIVSEIQSDFPLDFIFFRFGASIQAPFIVRE